jgi:hypothetical protein
VISDYQRVLSYNYKHIHGRICENEIGENYSSPTKPLYGSSIDGRTIDRSFIVLNLKNWSNFLKKVM